MAVKEENKEQAPVFEKDVLIAAADTLGTTPEIMVGALYEVTEPITKEQAQTKVTDYLKRPIRNK